ncbi:MAG: hypothetical protein Q6K80_07570 [Thermostichus sp. DG_1_6_bins_120]
MSIYEITREVMQSCVLTPEQELAINQILSEQAYTLSDLEALDQLIEAIVRQEVRTSPDCYENHVAA